ALEMSVIEDDDMIEHVAPNAADDPLAVGILPRTSRGNLDFFDAHVLDALLERHTVNGVPIPEEIARRGLPGKRLDDLLSGPLCCRVVGNAEMQDASALVSQHDKDKE